MTDPRDLCAPWRNRIVLPDPDEESDLGDLIDGAANLGSNLDPWNDWHPDAVTRRCDDLAERCRADARERRRLADDARLRLADASLRLDCYRRLNSRAYLAERFLLDALAELVPTSPVTDSVRKSYDATFASADLVQSLHRELTDLVDRWSAIVVELELTAPRLSSDADLADQRTNAVRRIGVARALFLAVGSDDD